MPEVATKETIYRISGTEGGERKVWRYRSFPDAQFRAQALRRSGGLIEFVHAEVCWTPVPQEQIDRVPVMDIDSMDLY